MMKLTIDGYPSIIHNKYFYWYRNIILNRLNNPILKQYTEKHHIIPRCLGGSDCKENLVHLSAREHYICHILLTKFTYNQDYFKCLKAIVCMSMKTIKNISKFDSKLYSIIKEKYSKELSIIMKNKSPFKIKHIHQKTMNTRKLKGTNIFITNNPMFNNELIKKKIEKTSGKHHYLVKKYSYRYSKDNKNTWINLPNDLTVKQICVLNNWSTSTFNNILSGKIPKRGNMTNIIIERINNEDKKNRT